MKKFSEFRKTQTWEDLRISLLWIPLIRIFIAYITSYLGLFMYADIMFLNPAEMLILYFFNTLIVMLSYLFIPLVIRFVIRRRPLQRNAWTCYLISPLLAVLGKSILVGMGISASKTGTIPILEVVAVYYVLIAGYKEATPFMYSAAADGYEDDDEYEENHDNEDDEYEDNDEETNI